MNRIIKGKQSLLFENAPYIVSAASVTGSKEAEGPLGKLFDMTNEDDLFGAQVVFGIARRIPFSEYSKIIFE